MKILFLQDDFPPRSFGGAGISTYELATEMQKLGNEVFVITTSRKKSEEGKENYNDIEVYKIYSKYNEKWRWYVSLHNVPVAREVEKILKTIKPDVVHINNIHTNLSYYCLKLAKKHSKCVIFTARDVMTFSFAKLETKRYLEKFDYRTTWLDHFHQAKKRWNPFRNYFIRRYLNYADKIFAISNSLKDALEQNGIRNVGVIYNGINADEWAFDAEKVKNFKNKSNLTDKKILLFSGRLSESKGGNKVIEALSQIVKEEPRTILLIAGSEDNYAESMKEKARSLGIENHLIFTGWLQREEIKIVYGASDVVLMPSICFDAFGRVNIEAMVSKKPVIGTCYGGTPEVVLDGITGYIVNPLYPERIAEKTLELLEDPEKAERFGKAGYERVKREFNIEDKALQYVNTYKDLLNR